MGTCKPCNKTLVIKKPLEIENFFLQRIFPECPILEKCLVGKSFLPIPIELKKEIFSSYFKYGLNPWA